MGAGKKRSEKKRARTEPSAPAGSFQRPYARAQPVPASLGELGRVDISINVANLTVNPQFVVVNAIQQGSGSWQREGDQVKLKSCHLRGMVKPNTGAFSTEPPCGLRMMLVWDRQTNGATPSADNLIYNVDQAGAQITTNAFSMTNYVNKKRFQILMDEFQTLPYVGSTGSDAASTDMHENGGTLDRYVKCKSLPTLYSTTANPATVAQITTGGLFFVIWAAGTTCWQFTGQARLKYVR